MKNSFRAIALAILFLPTVVLARSVTKTVDLSKVKVVPSSQTNPRWNLSVKGGLTFFINSQSTTIPHLLKPVARIEGSYQLSRYTAAGLELHGVTSSNENYRLLSASAVFRGYLKHGSLYRLWLRWGFGLGTGPAILNKDLRTSQPLAAHVNMGLAMDWTLFGDSFTVGLELLTDDLSTASFVTTLGFKL
jgi:hypothetical protein